MIFTRTFLKFNSNIAPLSPGGIKMNFTFKEAGQKTILATSKLICRFATTKLFLEPVLPIKKFNLL